MNDRASPNHQCSSIEANRSFNVNAYVFSTSVDDFTSDMQSADPIDFTTMTTMTTQKNVSPPAVRYTSTSTTATATANAKKRRRNLIHEKENEIMYAAGNTMTHKTLQSPKNGSGANGTRAAYNWKHNRPRTLVEVSRRKCSASAAVYAEKKKVSNAPAAKLASINKINAIRYKHLVRMVSRKESCKLCQRDDHCMVLSHHTKRSLSLHRLWRHSNGRRGTYKCTECGLLFTKRHKQILHMRLNHH